MMTSIRAEERVYPAHRGINKKNVQLPGSSHVEAEDIPSTFSDGSEADIPEADEAPPTRLPVPDAGKGS